jgi:hypothetical protein
LISGAIAATKIGCDLVPVVLRDCWETWRELNHIARLLDEAVDDGVIVVVGQRVVIERCCTSRLSKQRESRGIASKVGNVVANLLNRHTLVEQTKIASIWSTREAEDVRSVVEVHHHNILLISKELTIVDGVVSGSLNEAATIDPKQDSLLGLASLRFGPNVELQAIFNEGSGRSNDLIKDLDSVGPKSDCASVGVNRSVGNVWTA